MVQRNYKVVETAKRMAAYIHKIQDIHEVIKLNNKNLNDFLVLNEKFHPKSKVLMKLLNHLHSFKEVMPKKSGLEGFVNPYLFGHDYEREIFVGLPYAKYNGIILEHRITEEAPEQNRWYGRIILDENKFKAINGFEDISSWNFISKMLSEDPYYSVGDNLIGLFINECKYAYKLELKHSKRSI